jgi:hypothetical protein
MLIFGIVVHVNVAAVISSLIRLGHSINVTPTVFVAAVCLSNTGVARE